MQELENNTEKKENNIKDILEKTENDIKEGKITRRSGGSGSEEFVFSGDGTGLVFDKELPTKQISDTSKTPAQVDDYEKNAPRVEEVTLVLKSENTTVAAEPSAENREFLVPTSFRVDEKYNTPSVVEERRPMYSAYVPKFTDASENYRMADEARPSKKVSEALSVDPTAENETETEDAIIVDATGETPVEEEALLNVTKPVAPEVPAAKEAVRTVEDERAEIESLLLTQSAPKSAETAAPAENGEPADTAEVPQELFAMDSSEIPDPEGEALRVFDYPENATAEALPAEVDIAPLPSQGKRFSPKEYINVGQKLAFKDMFLDRLNSVKVRLGIVLLLTLVLGVLENMHLFGVDALAFLGFPGFPFALTILDIQVVIIIFCLAIPEMARGVRALTKGIFQSVLFLPIAFLLQMLHTITVMNTQTASVCLYGFVFGLGVIATVFGSYLRHQAAFLTFRHVGGNEEKLAVEKRTTRTLEKENFALDGAVDEYKSKTARVLRVSFVADFFARERKTAENTRHNLKYLLLSLGISLVTAIVMFFLGDGMISAVTTLTVTFYLSAPVTLLLAHRLPYYLSVRKASAVGGGVIGETSHYDYAGVDVVCFKDTEVFKKGDVALKHIILYDAAKEFTSVVEQMSALFSVIGGPLDVLFSDTLVKKCPPADDAILEDNGVFGHIGGVAFHVGNAAYMASKGIALPKDKDERETMDAATVVMYAAENGRIYAKFYLQYRLSLSYRTLLSSFAEEKIVSLIYARDYNLSVDLLRHLAGGRDLIRVIRDASASQLPEAQERISVGLVSSKDKMSAFSLLLLCRRYVRMQKNLLSAFWFVLGSGAFLGVMLAAFGLIALPSFVYGLWQIVLTVAMAVYAKKALEKSSGSNFGGFDKK